MFFKSSGKESSDSDGWLIDKFKSTGDLEYLGRLYEKYMHLVFGVCLKYLKDREASRDTTMQIFEKLMVEIPKREIDNFKPWLHVITRNHCLMHLRSEKSRLAREEKALENDQIFMESSYELHLNNESVLDRDLDALKKCIDLLKDEQKECIKLFYLEELCYQEIVDSTSFELKKVKSYIQNGKRNLKICMEENG
jgi:RNA polymerase sigma factor (sigma-70 family)